MFAIGLLLSGRAAWLLLMYDNLHIETWRRFFIVIGIGSCLMMLGGWSIYGAISARTSQDTTRHS
jgi:hypothetical protein